MGRKCVVVRDFDAASAADDVKRLSSLIQDCRKAACFVFWLDIVSADVKSNSNGNLSFRLSIRRAHRRFPAQSNPARAAALRSANTVPSLPPPAPV